MASVRFPDVTARPTEFLDCTNVALDEFPQLVPPFEAAPMWLRMQMPPEWYTRYDARLEDYCLLARRDC